MKEELKLLLKRCEETGGWFGIEIMSLDQRNTLGDTPLHTVCTWGEVPAIEMLIEAGADVNAQGDRGCTPVFNAIVAGSAPAIRALRRRGANFRLKSADGRSALDYAKNLRSSREVLDALSD
jgi:ankyrin repeat protein